MFNTEILARRECYLLYNETVNEFDTVRASRVAASAVDSRRMCPCCTLAGMRRDAACVPFLHETLIVEASG